MEKQRLSIKIIRSRRKTLSLQITPDAGLLIRAPYHVSESEILQFVESRQNWIEKHLIKMQKRREEQEHLPALSHEEIRQLAGKAMTVIPERVAYYAPLVGVDYGRITIRNQKTRWGSCSSRGNLNFNCLLMLTPPEIIDYVVVHELCHRKEMNHSPMFWKEVGNVLPDYARRRKWLKENGGALITRMLLSEK